MKVECLLTGQEGQIKALSGDVLDVLAVVTEQTMLMEDDVFFDFVCSICDDTGKLVQPGLVIKTLMELV